MQNDMAKGRKTITRSLAPIVTGIIVTALVIAGVIYSVFWSVPGKHYVSESAGLYHIAFDLLEYSKASALGEESAINANTEEFVSILNSVSPTVEMWEPHLIGPEGMIIDPWKRPLKAFILPEGNDAIEDPKLQQLDARYRIVVWSLGPDGRNDFGQGDDIFIGIRPDGTVEGDQNLWVAVKRRGLRAVFRR